jgi:osmoprotectant transport system ATP-binding protein
MADVAAVRGDGAPMIVLRDVTKRFGSRVAVDRVSLAVASGTTHVLLGGSGSGKSTILKMILGLLSPDEGSIAVDGQPVRGIGGRADARRIGYVVQEGALFPHLTARSNVALAARAQGWSAERIASRLERLSRVVALEPELLERYPSELSGGQRQRIGLMRALMLDPPVVLLDEPLGSLDPIGRAGLQEQLALVFRDLAKTCVVVTHDIREAFVLGSTITLLSEGRVVQQGTFAELARSPADPFVADFLRAQAPPPEMTAYL